jgi:hypothetical protein
VNSKRIYLSLVVLISLFLLFIGCSSVMEGIVGSPDTTKQGTQKAPAKAESEKTTPVPVSGDPSEQKLIGTWTNPQYNNDGRSAKLEYALKSDGTISYIAYDKDDGSGKRYEGTIQYKEKWMDSQGRLCGKSTVTLSGGMSWETLDRISADGRSLEVQSGTSTIDPKGPRYSIYYRK